MSLWHDLVPKLAIISSDYTKNIQYELDLGLAALDEFAKDILSGRLRVLDKQDLTIRLGNINEDEDETKTPPGVNAQSNKTPDHTSVQAAVRPTDVETLKQVSDKTEEKRNGQEEENERGGSKKRNKEEMGGNNTPEQDKRIKRGASVRAQGIISKQVNVNLTAKMRRPQEAEGPMGPEARSRADNNKENRTDNVPLVQVKQEKVSLPPADPSDAPEPPTGPPEPPAAPPAVAVKQERGSEADAMPPPSMPAPSSKARRGKAKKKTEEEKEKEIEETKEEEETGRRSTRTRKQIEVVSSAGKRTTRMNSRATNSTSQDEEMPPPPPPEPRPKRTRAKKQQPEAASDVKEVAQSSDSGVRSELSSEYHSAENASEIDPNQKTRPKRTRRGRKASPAKDVEGTHPEGSLLSSPVISAPAKKLKKSRSPDGRPVKGAGISSNVTEISSKGAEISSKGAEILSKGAKISSKGAEISSKRTEHDQGVKDVTAEGLLVEETGAAIRENNEAMDGQEKQSSKIPKIMLKRMNMEEMLIADGGPSAAIHLTDNAVAAGDTTVILTASTFAHQTGTPTKKTPNMNETVVLESNNSQRASVVLDGKPAAAMNETVVISVCSAVSDQMTNDDSRLTADDTEEIEDTPPRSMIPVKLPTSAVKERVQHYEQLLANGGAGASGGARLTRTKTRALAKQSVDADNISPSDNVQKGTLNPSMLAKLNSMPLFKNPQITLSASKPRANIVASVKSFLPMSASKATPAPGAAAPAPGAAAPAPAAAARAREDETREDARKKKEALLEAKREEQRRRREQKMAAAAAARDAQARTRAAQLEAKAQGWQEKQAHVDQGKLEKQREAERKRAALEKKVAETEERRRAEETARQARLEEEQRRAETVRRKQQEDAERIRKEDQQTEREMQQARQLYLEKEKKEREKERQKMLLLQQKQRMDTDKMHTPMKMAGTPCKPMAPVHMADGFQYLNSDSEDEQRPKKKHTTPDWGRSEARLRQLQVQERIAAQHIDRLFSVQRHTPDLGELFPGIDRRNLKRTSSAVWRTPPRLPHLPE